MKDYKELQAKFKCIKGLQTNQNKMIYQEDVQ